MEILYESTCDLGLDQVIYQSLYFEFLPPFLTPKIQQSFNFNEIVKDDSSVPDIIISCGRKSVIPNIVLKKYFKKKFNKDLKNEIKDENKRIEQFKTFEKELHSLTENYTFSNMHSLYIWNNKEYISSRSEFADKSEITKKTICNVCKNQTHSKRLNRVSKSFSIKL